MLNRLHCGGAEDVANLWLVQLAEASALQATSPDGYRHSGDGAAVEQQRGVCTHEAVHRTAGLSAVPASRPRSARPPPAAAGWPAFVVKMALETRIESLLTKSRLFGRGRAAPGFLYDQRTGRDVPGLHPELPVASSARANHAVEGRRPAAESLHLEVDLLEFLKLSRRAF